MIALIICSPLIIIFITYFTLARHISILQKFYCKIGWHSKPVGFEDIDFDGASAHCRCKWCKYEGLIDSQGNLF